MRLQTKKASSIRIIRVIAILIMTLIIRICSAQDTNTNRTLQKISQNLHYTLIFDDTPRILKNIPTELNFKTDNFEEYFDCKVTKIGNIILLKNKYSYEDRLPKVSFMEIENRLSSLEKKARKILPKTNDPLYFSKLPDQILQKLFREKSKEDLASGVVIASLNSSTIEILRDLSLQPYLSNQLSLNQVLQKIKNLKKDNTSLKIVKTNGITPEILVLEGFLGNSDFKYQYGLSHGFIINKGVSYTSIEGNIFATSSFESDTPPSKESISALLKLKDNFKDINIYKNPNDTYLQNYFINKFNSINTIYNIDTSMKNKCIAVYGEIYSTSNEILRSILDLFNLEIVRQENSNQLLRPRTPPFPQTIDEMNSNISEFLPLEIGKFNGNILDLYKRYINHIRNITKDNFKKDKILPLSGSDNILTDYISCLFLISEIEAINTKNKYKSPYWITNFQDLILKIENSKSNHEEFSLQLIDSKNNKVVFTRHGLRPKKI